jgi:hypothetical protein
MTKSLMQELLDEEAILGYRGNKTTMEERKAIHVLIKLARDNPPACWGQDDCSSRALATCPWRIDCWDHGFQERFNGSDD